MTADTYVTDAKLTIGDDRRLYVHGTAGDDNVSIRALGGGRVRVNVTSTYTLNRNINAYIATAKIAPSIPIDAVPGEAAQIDVTFPAGRGVGTVTSWRVSFHAAG